MTKTGNHKNKNKKRWLTLWQIKPGKKDPQFTGGVVVGVVVGTVVGVVVGVVVGTVVGVVVGVVVVGVVVGVVVEYVNIHS
jgi:hypothetical protein